jgi:hypothetical protein
VIILLPSCDSEGQSKVRRTLGDVGHGRRQSEAPAVILVDIDAASDGTVQMEGLRYAGMTRATVRLELLVQRRTALADLLLGAAR